MVLEELQVIQTGLERFFGQTALLLPALCGTPLPAQAQPAGRVHRIGFLALGGRPAPPLPSLEAF
jgi:hypothetical protein